MRHVRLVLAMTVFSLIVVGQQETTAAPEEGQSANREDSSKPILSNDSLSAEQTAVYRAVLADYLKGSDGALNLANMTEPLDRSDRACFKGLESGDAMPPAPVIHKLEPAILVNTKIMLVDATRQGETVKGNDPQNLLKKAIDDHEKVTNEQLDESVKRAFQTGLFTLSEIAFDKEHRRAVVGYSFVCGMLCGHGNTLILKRVGQDWKVAKRCGGWIS